MNDRRHPLRLAILALAALTLATIGVQAGTTYFLTDRNGQIPFPISPPNRATGGPGAIDNMAIGQTTPAAGAFTTLKSSDGLVCPSFFTIGAPAAATDTAFFLATRAYVVVSAREVHAVAAGGASVVQLVKDTGTNAPGAGTDLLTNNTNTGFDLNATANTPQTGALIATLATKTLAAGDRLSVDFAQAIQASSGIVVTVCLAPQ